MSTPSIAIVIPAHDEAENLPALIDGLRLLAEQHGAEVIVVNDGSADRTAQGRGASLVGGRSKGCRDQNIAQAYAKPGETGGFERKSQMMNTACKVRVRSACDRGNVMQS